MINWRFLDQQMVKKGAATLTNWNAHGVISIHHVLMIHAMSKIAAALKDDQTDLIAFLQCRSASWGWNIERTSPSSFSFLKNTAAYLKLLVRIYFLLTQQEKLSLHYWTFTEQLQDHQVSSSTTLQFLQSEAIG